MTNWKIGTRIACGFGAVLVITLTLGVFAYFQLNGIDQSATRLKDDTTPGVAQSTQILDGTRIKATLLLDHILANTEEEKQRVERQMDTTTAKVGKAIESYEATITLADDKALFQTLKSTRAPYLASYDKALALSRADKDKEAIAILKSEVEPRRQALADAVEAVTAYNQKTAEELTGKIASAVDWTSTAVVIFVFLGLVVGVVVSVFITRSIAAPLTRAINHLQEIANGDLSTDAPAAFQVRGDEIGMLARAKQSMIVNLRNMVQEIGSGVKVLSASSAELLASSGQMTTGSRHASDKAHLVSAAAEEMSANITSVAAGMGQTTHSLTNVASATEQMTATIGEIAGNSEKARRITDDATRQASRITEQINQLGEAAREIGKVTETITEISSQTNLLALNATIEAARAGSAGKGFAVVATEIKALAQQTATATEDIKARIAGVQTATASGISEIGKISQVIQDVSAIVGSIAAAIEEQSAATRNISQNISEASQGVSDANTRVSETSLVSREIARDIVSVDQAAGEMAMSGDSVRANAAQLSDVAGQLQHSIERFRV